MTILCTQNLVEQSFKNLKIFFVLLKGKLFILSEKLINLHNSKQEFKQEFKPYIRPFLTTKNNIVL